MWDITITLQSLVPQTKNLFYHSIAGSKNLFDVKIQRGDDGFVAEQRALNNEGPEGQQLNNSDEIAPGLFLN